MCTVIFFPSADKQVFVSLRDEDPRRSRAYAPERHTRGPLSWICPLDPEGGGTWFAANQFGSVVILLNGGFEKHQRQPGYARSRGLIVTDLVASDGILLEWSLLSLERIEPFTLVVWEERQLYQLVWDGQHRHRKKLDAQQPQIWSSSTLYDGVARDRRKNRFLHWVGSRTVINPQQLLDFFEMDREPENGFLINRKEAVQTLSYTFLEWQPGEITFRYEDFIQQSVQMQTLTIPARPDPLLQVCAAQIT